MDIRDLTQTLWMTHVMIGLAVLYFIYTICNKFYHHTTTHALWICHLISCLRKEEAVYNAFSRNIHLQIACGYAVFDPRTDADLDAPSKAGRSGYVRKQKTVKNIFLPLRLKPAAVFLRHPFFGASLPHTTARPQAKVHPQDCAHRPALTHRHRWKPLHYTVCHSVHSER